MKKKKINITLLICWLFEFIMFIFVNFNGASIKTLVFIGFLMLLCFVGFVGDEIITEIRDDYNNSSNNNNSDNANS